MKDWNGNSASTYKCLGASNHTDKERENMDYYATEPLAAELLLQIEDIPKDRWVWECASGENHLADVFEGNGYKVLKSDVVQRKPDVVLFDFLNDEPKHKPFNGTIITNPPYKFAQEFVERALDLISDGNKVCMFLKVQFLEGKKRKALFEKYPPKTVWVSSSRLLCAKNGDFKGMRDGGGSAVAYAWYVWEKGYKGEAKLKWFN